MDDIWAQKSLSDRELAIFNAELERSRRHTIVAYLLWFVFGMLGVHNFYIGKVRWGVANLVLVTIGPIAFAAGLVLNPEMLADTEEHFAGLGLMVSGAFAFATAGLLWIWDLFTLPLQIRRRENALRVNLLSRLRAERAGNPWGAA